MIDITLAFEKETGLDVVDPLGDVTISDGSSSIVLTTTYLDFMVGRFDCGIQPSSWRESRFSRSC